MKREIFISTGESSGDNIGALLTAELRRRSRGIRITGFGGEKMAAAGARVDQSLLNGAVMALTGIFRHLSMFLSLLGGLKRKWKTRPPSAVVCIDFPGFNLRVARIAHRLGIPVYYYACPQVWAWGANRLLLIRRLVKRAFLILPFEQALYRSFGIDGRFVGHPLTESLPRKFPPRSAVLRKAGFDPRRPLCVILPGSRRGELEHHVPVLAGAMERVRTHPALRKAQWAVIAAPRMPNELFAPLVNAGAALVSDPGFHLRAHATLAWVSSGTATLELGLLGIPQAVIYRGGFLNYLAVRAVIKVKWVSLVNLILGREEVPELMQYSATPENLAEATRRVLLGRGARAKRVAVELRRAIGNLRPTREVAGTILGDLARRTQ